MTSSERTRYGLVTVVIPTRNRLALLREGAARVPKQMLLDSQLAIVNDASTTDVDLAQKPPRPAN